MNHSSTRGFAFVVAILVVGAVVALAGIRNGWFDTHEQPIGLRSVEEPTTGLERDATTVAKSNEENEAGLLKALGVNSDEMVEVGGVRRPKRDVEFERATTKTESIDSPFTNPGHAPFLKWNENEQVAGLYRELANPEKPKAATSTFFMPEPFDLEKYENDPQAYLSKIRPGRVFQPAKPGPDVIPLTPKSKGFVEILQGESVILRIEGEAGIAGTPVTFYTPQVGEFDNRLKTYSVATDEDGIATATYKATPGTMGLIDILAASPIHSGQVHYVVKVNLPREISTRGPQK